jgi:hypothetical protein
MYKLVDLAGFTTLKCKGVKSAKLSSSDFDKLVATLGTMKVGGNIQWCTLLGYKKGQKSLDKMYRPFNNLKRVILLDEIGK